MIDGYLLNMRVSDDVGDGKGQARHGMRLAPRDAQGAFRDDIIDGCVGTVQAIANLLAAVGATQGEVDAAIRRMDERDGNRGRF